MFKIHLNTNLLELIKPLIPVIKRKQLLIYKGIFIVPIKIFIHV